MMTYIQSFPKAQRAAVADMIATGNTTTEASIQFQSLLPGAAAQAMEFSRTLQAGGRISKDTMNQALNNASKEAKQSAKINSERFKYDESIQAQGGAVFELAARKTDAFGQAMGEQAKATQNANLAENLTKAKQRLSEFSNNFQLALANSGMFDSLMTSFEALANFTKEVVIPLFNVFAQAITAITPVVVSLLVPAFKALGAFIESTVVPGFTILGNWIKTAVIPIFERAYDIVSNVVGSLFSFLDVADAGTEGLGIFEEVLYTISEFIEDNLEPILIGFGVIMGTILVGKVMAFGAAMLTTLAPIASFVLNVLRMGAQAALTAAQFLLMNPPILAIVAAAGLLVYGFKKLGGDFSMLGDGVKWLSSYFTQFGQNMTLMYYKLMDKITVGDKYKKLAEDQEKAIKDTQDQRTKIEEDLAARRKANLKAVEDAEVKKLADEKAAAAANAAAAATGNAEVSAKQAADNAKAAKRQEDREARKAKREQDNIDRKKKAELDAVSARSAADKKAVDDKKSEEDAKKDETNPSVSMSDPIAMLKSFAAQQKSAFTQEAKALEDKEKARSELKMASQEQVKAMEEASKATSAEEKKAAEARITEAEARLAKASELNKKADDEINKALERMKLAKEGKDPGPTKVAEGKPAPVVKPEAAKPEAAKPATSEPAKAQGAVPALNQDVQKNLELVKAALQKRGMNDPKYIAATLGNVMKETGGKSVSENMDYSKTSNERIKKIFGSRAEGKTDKELDTIKKDPKQMGEMMYGNKTKMGQQMGNTEPGDGFKYRGRGFIQLTGKSNYAAASKDIYGDNRLVDNPDMVNDPAVAAEVSAWYMKKGQGSMAKKLGVDTNNMSQAQANLLATSQIAGGDIRKKGAIGEELAGKVDKFAGSSQIQAIAAAPSGPATASATPKPPVTSTATAAEAAKAAKARADFAANDPRRAAMAADVKPVEAKPVEAKPVEAKPVEAKPVEAKPVEPKPVEAKPLTAVGTNVAPKIDETETPQSAMQTLIKDGIIPTTIAFQSLIKNGITPMLSSVQIKPVKVEPVKAEPVKAEPVKVEVPKIEPVKAQPVDLGSYEQTLTASTKAIIDTAKLSQPTDQSLAVKESLTSTANNLITGGKAMISGFQTTALDLSSSFINGLDLTTSNLTSSLTTSFQDGLSSNLDLFNTGFSNNFEMIGDTFASTFEKLDPFTENILSAAGHISDAENNIAENQKNIVLAQSELADADISDDRREQLNDFIQVAQENIGMQNSSMAYNKDAMNANIMARAESPKSEIIAQKEKEMQEQIAMEKQQAENREQLRKQEMVAMNDSASNQNTASGDSSDLNTALRELIAINKRTADLNEKQLSVQSSLSGDLFA